MSIGAILDAHEDDHGLYVTGQLDLVAPYDRTAYDEMKAGRLTGMSIRYRPARIAWGWLSGVAKKVRKLLEIAMDEVSMVWYPANEQAQVLEVKSRRSTPDGNEGNNMADDPNELGALIERYAVRTWGELESLAALMQLRAYAQDPDVKRAAFKLEMKANRTRNELGNAEIDRQYKAWSERFDASMAECRAYLREVKTARARGEKAPPHYRHNPEAYQSWRQQRAWLEANGRG